MDLEQINLLPTYAMLGHICNLCGVINPFISAKPYENSMLNYLKFYSLRLTGASNSYKRLSLFMLLLVVFVLNK